MKTVKGMYAFTFWERYVGCIYQFEVCTTLYFVLLSEQSSGTDKLNQTTFIFWKVQNNVSRFIGMREREYKSFIYV